MTRFWSLVLGSLAALGASVWAWQEQPAASLEMRPPATLDGAQLFQFKGCSACHSGPDTVSRMVEFPSLRDASSWAGERRPGLDSAGYLAESMREPAAFISPAWVGGGPITAMPDLGLTEEEIAAITEYLLQG